MAKKNKPPPSLAQIAHQVTWRLQGDLARQKIVYLSIGAQLDRVRREKLWRALNYDSIESWSEERLKLGRASLYRYLQIYDWVKEQHPEWLRPKPGFIPELSDVAELAAIAPAMRAELVALGLRDFTTMRA